MANKQEMRRLFTFGFGQTDPLTGLSLASCYVWVEGDSLEDCRERMIERFGNRYPNAVGNWAFDYASADDAGVDRYRLTEIDFETGYTGEVIHVSRIVRNDPDEEGGD